MDPLLLTALILAVLVVLYIIIRARRRVQRDTRKELEKLKKKNTKNHLYFLYRVYMATPVLRRYFIKMKNMLRTSYPADEISLNAKTTRQMTRFLLISLAILVAIFAFGGNDIAYILVGFLAVYILFTNMVNNSCKKMQSDILDQLDTLISDVHSNYDDAKVPSIALANTLDELPYEIGLHATIIHDMITSSNPDAEIQNYVDVAPNRFLLLFAAILETVEEHGDKLINGRSMFIKNLDYLKQELGNERVRLQKRQNAFMGKTYAVLMALFILKPIQLWGMSNLPETTGFYKGAFGTIALAIIMVVTFTCYELINILKDDPDDMGKDDKLFKKFADIPVVKKYLTAYIDHNYSKSIRTTDKLKATGDRSGLNVFILKRCALAIVFFIVTIGLSLYSIGRERHLLLTDFSTAYASSIVPDEEYRESMRMASKQYIKDAKKTGTTETYTQMLGDEYAPVYKDLMVKELSDRTTAYNEQYFRWWMLVAALFAGVVGYNIPLLLLLYKQRIMGMARDDEVAQFRTLILILMHEDGMTLNRILEWMEKFAHAFKASITDCIFSLEQNEEKALMEMREKEKGFAPFRRMCDALLSVDKVGVESAFDGFESDREYYKDKRKEDNDVLLKKCSFTASLLELIPASLVTIIYLVMPLVTLAMNMYKEMDFQSFLN